MDPSWDNEPKMDPIEFLAQFSSTAQPKKQPPLPHLFAQLLLALLPLLAFATVCALPPLSAAPAAALRRWLGPLVVSGVATVQSVQSACRSPPLTAVLETAGACVGIQFYGAVLPLLFWASAPPPHPASASPLPGRAAPCLRTPLSADIRSPPRQAAPPQAAAPAPTTQER